MGTKEKFCVVRIKDVTPSATKATLRGERGSALSSFAILLFDPIASLCYSSGSFFELAFDLTADFATGLAITESCRN